MSNVAGSARFSIETVAGMQGKRENGPPEIRFAKPSDVPDIVEIDRISDSPAWTGEAYRESLSSGSASICLALLGKRIVGFCCFRIIESEMEILKLAVDPAFRRRGFGRRLLWDAIACFQAKGEKKVFLEVRSGNRAAIELYSSQGFTKAGVRKKYYADPPEDAQIMVLPLKAK